MPKKDKCKEQRNVKEEDNKYTQITPKEQEKTYHISKTLEEFE